ncbi:MAG: CoA transferase [Bacteroidetes bacterium]|nr:CoA transferase [Bacteroidota bacterium]HET6245298.1 CoA transferase [Bacteroidia bacterium]
MNFFEGLTVIELASVLAGPATGMFFSELGARVIKIENPLTGGDVTRQWKTQSESPQSSVSAYYSSVNYNKEVHFIDLNSKQGKNKLYALLKNADILISNFKEGDAEKLGMDYNTIKKLNSKLIYAFLGGFPKGINRVAFDVVLQAETGFMSMNGTEQSGPVKMPVALIDVLAAHQLKQALLIALIHKERTGKGSYVSTTLYESAIASLVNQASNYLMQGIVPKPIGSIHPNIAPYGETFSTKDGKSIVMAIGSDKQFKSLCTILNISDQEDYKTNTCRIKNRKQLSDLLTIELKKHHSKGLMKKFETKNIPAGLIKNLEEVFNQPEAKNMILEENNQGQVTKTIKSIAFKSDFL